MVVVVVVMSVATVLVDKVLVVERLSVVGASVGTTVDVEMAVTVLVMVGVGAIMETVLEAV